MSLQRSKELREKRAALWAQAQALLTKDNQTAEDRSRFDIMLADCDTLKGDIDRIERADKLEQELRTTVAPQNGSVSDETRTHSKEHSASFRKWMATGDASELRTYAPLSVGTGSGAGYFVPQSMFNSIESALKTFGGVREVAQVLPTSTGNDLILPTSDDTSNAGELVSENSDTTEQNPTVGRLILNAFRYSSRAIRVSTELIQDSNFDIENYLGGIMAERVGRITNLHFSTGDGNGKPNGIVTAATLGATAAAVSTISYDDLVELEHSVDPAYRKGARFMFADSALKTVKKLKDDLGRPLWVPGIAVKAPDTILGYEYGVNQDMAAPAASAKSVLFGALNKYIVRSVRDVTIVRLNELYALQGQVGFCAFARYDGDLIDAGSHPVRYLQMAAS